MVYPPTRGIPVFGHTGSADASGEVAIQMYRQETGAAIDMPAGAQLIIESVYCGSSADIDTQIRWSAGEDTRAILYNYGNGTQCPTVVATYPHGRYGPMGAKPTLTGSGAGACIGGFVGYLVKVQ